MRKPVILDFLFSPLGSALSIKRGKGRVQELDQDRPQATDKVFKGCFFKPRFSAMVVYATLYVLSFEWLIGRKILLIFLSSESLSFALNLMQTS